MSYTLIRESFPVARKPHKCIWCGQGIPVGELHRHEVSRYDELQNFRWHLECDRDAAAWFGSGEEEFLPYSNDRPAKLSSTDISHREP